eukprot:CAMPEP_0182434784 /NCGR_PEP_ID=MMETSP1167-20130531/71811_1 /TAXON_ID=2988 /ORGANISM="Mallomonas Sp, Strain CCMP3275" /LENGTH=453 /DNA_ID=CAMNT_0024625039 /DNA_START=49 /DNA_END=1410 /DNA_ORIENTATION=-
MSKPSHQWDVANAQHMPIQHDDGIIDAPTVLSPFEAERFVEGLTKFSLEEVGSSKWFEQHVRIEKLNLQGHQNAMTNSDEYVLEAILTFDKLPVLIHDLLIIEAWKENVYPLLIDQVAGKNNMRIYFILYHEATLTNFLEVLLYHKHVCECGGELLLELVDYTARKIMRLNGGYNFRDIEPISDRVSRNGGSIKDVADELEARTPKQELTKYITEIEFRICISSVAMARFLCEHCEVLPLNVISRITDTHDMLMCFIPLIENPPWTRRRQNGSWEKLVDSKWLTIPPIDLLKITKLEGQPWLALYNLVAKKVYRDRYHLNSFRKTQLLRVRKYINDVLLDQLPVLADIQRYMDELAISEVPEPVGSTNSVFLFQQVALLREEMLRGQKWEEIAHKQIENIFIMTDATDRDLRRIAELYSDDTVGDVMDPREKTLGRDPLDGQGDAVEEEFEDI